MRYILVENSNSPHEEGLIAILNVLKSLGRDTTVFLGASHVDRARQLGIHELAHRVITLKETPWAETHTATHEIGHALAALHPSDSARLWFTERVGASAWEPGSAMDYAQSGAESFAESYAVCSLGERTESSGQYRIASCDDLWHALDLMRSDASPANIRTA